MKIIIEATTLEDAITAVYLQGWCDGSGQNQFEANENFYNRISKALGLFNKVVNGETELCSVENLKPHPSKVSESLHQNHDSDQGS